MGDAIVLQLHRWGVHDHPGLGDPDAAARGYGVLLWFHTDEVDAAAGRAVALGADVVQELLLNPRSGQLELWVRDPDGYTVVVSGPPVDGP